MSILAAGKRDRRITLLREAQVDNHGDVQTAFTNVCTVWGSYRPLRASERFAQSGNLAQAEVEFQILYSSDVSWLSPADRLSFDGAEYEIIEVTEIGRQKGLSVIAKRRDVVNG